MMRFIYNSAWVYVLDQRVDVIIIRWLQP